MRNVQFAPASDPRALILPALAEDPAVRCVVMLSEAEIRRGWNLRHVLDRIAKGKALQVDRRIAVVKR